MNVAAIFGNGALEVEYTQPKAHEEAAVVASPASGAMVEEEIEEDEADLDECRGNLRKRSPGSRIHPAQSPRRSSSCSQPCVRRHGRGRDRGGRSRFR